MRTLGHCQDHDLTLYIGCRCGAGRRVRARDECRAMRGEAVEYLQRAGWFSCEGCGSTTASVSVYRDGIGYATQLENWRVDGAAVPRPIEGAGP